MVINAEVMHNRYIFVCVCFVLSLIFLLRAIASLVFDFFLCLLLFYMYIFDCGSTVAGSFFFFCLILNAAPFF